VPVNITICGEPVELSATESVAEKLAADAGVKVTEIVQELVAASVVPQLFVEIAKSVGFVPPSVTLLIVSGAPPVFESVMFCAVAVVPTGVLTKGTVDGEMPAIGTVPVPVNVVVCGDPVALSATESVAEKLVADAGVKVTRIVQELVAASVVPQLFVEIAKSVGFDPVMVMPLIASEPVP